MSTQIQVLPPLSGLSSRAEVVRAAITNLKTSIMESSLSLGRLLKEVRDNQYALLWGFPRFGQWVEDESGLDISERQCFYLIAVVERAEALGIPDEQLHRVKLSKLKAIFSLPADTDPDIVRGLVVDAEDNTLKTVQEAVGILKNEAYVYKTIKLERIVAEDTWDPAMERARREYGNTIGFNGNLADIPDSRCIELIFADWNAQPNEVEYDEQETLDAEWEDVILPEAA